MQNLRNVDHYLSSFADDIKLTASAWDLTDDSLICAFGPTASTDLLSLKRLRRNADGSRVLEAIAAWDARSPQPDLQHDSIVNLHHFSDSRTIVLILEGGDIVVIREEIQPGEDAVEIVGSVDDGIAAAAWSPDEELVLLATKSDQLLFMTRQFDSTATVTLTTEDLKVSNHVSVGWGKVETQFKGRGARALRDPTVPENVDVGTLSSTDDGKIYISWRGDGEYVAVNSILEEPKRRVIRFLSREGVLEDVSEAVDGQEGALAWKPTGQIIASTRRKADRAEIIFFERNGLRHGEFDLRLTTDDLRAISAISLQWNSDSTVLAVTLDSRVQLWTSSNYHWYLKQEIDLGRGASLLTHAQWHPEKPLHLASDTSDRLSVTQHISQYSTGSTAPPHDAGIVATIDGKRLAVTPLRIANVPPPMAYDELEMQQPAVDVCIHPHGKHIAVLHSDSASLYECDYNDRPAKRARLCGSLKLENDSHHGLTTPRQIAVDSDGTISVLAATDRSPYALLARQHLTASTAAYEEVPHNISSLFSSVTSATTVLHDRSGDLQGVAHKGSQADFRTIEKLADLPSACLDVQVWQDQDFTIAFGRTASGQLHVVSSQQSLKVTGCTSYVVTPSHLIFTTSQHLLKFVHLHDGLLDIPPDEPEKDERCRNVERGAKIVTVVPSTFALILQMPRGNLETIYPRALVLTGIRQSVSAGDYRKAFLICRGQRVDPNILYDYAPKRLLSDVDLFIKQLKSVTYIDLFLSSLSEEDTSVTLYRDTAAQTSNAAIDAKVVQHAQTNPDVKVSKVNTVCDAFIESLSKLGPQYLQSIITAHVSKIPPDLEAGLTLVSQLRTHNDGQDLEQAVEHICFLGDVNRLYDTALGMYDLEVTLLVAQQSQKDPREYLPYLQSLRDMDINRRRYTIDNDLKRYVKALKSLHALDSFEELIRYVDRHELYAHAVEIYRHDKPRLHRLMRLHAEHLMSRNRYGDAGVAFEFVGDCQAAYEAYRAAGQWRETLTTAARIPIPEHEMVELAQALADGLHESKDYTSEAVIYLDYLDDLPNAVRLHCKAYNFDEATRLAILRRSPQLLEQVVDPGLVECSGLMTELLAEMKTQLNAQIPRLRELRVKKMEEPMAFLDAAENEGGDFPDNLSIAPTDASTSAGTFMTRYTNRSTGTLATNATRRTSKNRRREERKRARGKKGTVYEEEYLVNSITRLIERLSETGTDLSNLVQGLMRRSMRERAVAVEHAMIEVEQLCREHMAEVYETPSAAVTAAETALEQRRPQGGEGVLWDTLVSTQKKAEAPLLKAFERLSLLAE